MGKLITGIRHLVQVLRCARRSSAGDHLHDTARKAKKQEAGSFIRLQDPLYQDMRLAREALKSSAVPDEHWDAFLTFHERFGGVLDHFGLNRVVWGIVHPDSEWIEKGVLD